MSEQPSGWAVGWTAFAGIFMIIGGLFQALQGLIALFNNEFVVVTGKYVFQFNVTTWGWIHLILGLVIVLAGVYVFGGAVWARTIGVILAGFSMLVNFAWLPHYPIWSILIIVADGFVIWALTAHGRDFANY